MEKWRTYTDSVALWRRPAGWRTRSCWTSAGHPRCRTRPSPRPSCGCCVCELVYPSSPTTTTQQSHLIHHTICILSIYIEKRTIYIACHRDRQYLYIYTSIPNISHTDIHNPDPITRDSLH